jgi:hypothetical protein
MDVFMDLLGTIESQDLIAQLFLALLELNFGLQEHDVVLDLPAAAPDTRILHLNLILAMMQKYGAKVLQNIKQVLSFIKNVLATRDVEVLPLGLALLVTLLSNGTRRFTYKYIKY